MQALFPFLYGSDGKLSAMAALGLALVIIAVMWALAKIPFLRAVKP